MKRLLYLFVLLLSLSLWSCGSKDDGIDDPDVPENPEQPENPDVPEYVELYVSEYDLVLGAQGDEVSFDIECNTKWSIENESGWCKTDVASGEGDGTVKVTAEAYYENADRNAVLTVKAGNETRTVQVTQKHEDALILSKDKFDVAQEGGTISVEWQSNVDCRLTIPWKFEAWIKEAPKSKGLVTTTFDLVISENEAYDKRDGYVIVSGNGLRDTVHIYQAQIDQLILTQDIYRLQAEGGDITVELKTNVDYEITIPGDATSWISRVETRAIREDRLDFHIEANGNDKERTAKIVVKDKNSALDDTIYVHQGGKGVFAGDVVLETTEDVQAFAARGIKKLMGSLIVQGSNLGSLTALSDKLEEINGNLEINCSSLNSFDGLYGLKRIGGNLTIKDGRFTSFEGLNNLEHIGGSFRITSSSSLGSLQNFSGLGSLSEIGGDFEISSSSDYSLGSLENFVGLDNLCRIGGSFRITSSSSSSSLESLQNFSGLGSLSEIGGDFEVSSSSCSYRSSLGSLENFVGLDNLGRIGGSFRITSSSSSSSSSSLESLQNFSGLGSLSEIGGDFEVSSSSESSSSESLGSLQNFVGLDNLGRIGGSFRITSSSSSSSRSSSSLASLQNFSGLGSLTEIVGDFEVSSSSGYSSSLGSLENFVGLDNLCRIGGSFRITSDYSLESLQNLSGLGSLTAIGGDFISEDKFFSAKTGLEKLVTVGGEMNVYGDAHFTALQSVGGALSLSTFSSSSSSSSSQSNLYLPALKMVGGTFGLRYFKSVDIPKLESIEGAFTITYVNAIGTLDNLKTVGDITIKNCKELTDFCNWKPVLTDYNGTFSVSGCGYNPTKYQILNGACSKLPEE